MAADKEFLKENHLENVYKRLKKINEYVLTNNHTNEAGDPQQDAQQAPAPPDPNAQDGVMPQGNGGAPMPPPDGAQGGAPQGDALQGDMQQPPAGDVAMPPAGPDPTMGAEAPDNAGMDGEPVEDVEMEGEVGADDEVIDVDDLTQSQEASEYKIDGVDDKLSKLLSIANKFAQAIEANDAKLEDLKAEVERRNPTDIEKINIRSQNSKPFNVNPGEYWNEVKENNPHYEVISDNSVAPNEEDKLYTISKEDLDNFNTGEIERSFSDIPKNLLGYF